MLWSWVILLVSLGVCWQTHLLHLSPIRFALLCLVLLMPVLWMEIRWQALSRFLENVFRSSGKTCFFLFVCLVAVVKFYWTPGYRLTTIGDGPPHALTAWMTYQALRHGEIPFWTNDWACGSPFLQFYPPLFFYLAAALLFVRENLLLVLQVLLTLFHLASGFTMYRLVRAMGLERRGAYLSALLYAMAPWHVFQLFHFNRFPVAPVYALLPLLFLSVERVERDQVGAALLGSACLAGIALSHQGYAVFTSIFFVLYTCVRLLSSKGSVVCPKKTAFLFHIAGTGLLGFGMAALLLVPHLLESHLLPFLPSLGKAQGSKGFLMDNPYLFTLFAWRRQPVGHTGYLGISLFLFSLLGVVGIVKQGGRRRAALLVCYAFSIFLVLGHENTLYSYIPFVYSQFYAGRYLIFLVFFLSIASGFSLPLLEDWMNKRGASRSGPPVPTGPLASQSVIGAQRKGLRASVLGFLRPRLLLVSLVIIVLDLGPHIHYLQESPRYPLPDQERVYASIRKKKAADPNRLSRALDIPKNSRERNHGSLILPLEASCPTPEAGQFGTLASYAYIFKMLKNIRETIPFEQNFSERFRDVFFLLNVGYVFTDMFPAPVAEQLGGENFGGALWLFTFPHTSPVLASAALENIGRKWEPPVTPLAFILDRWNPPDAVDKILDAMGIDLDTGSAKRILVRSGTKAPPSFQEPVGPVHVGAMEQGMTYTRLLVTATSDCYLRISHSWFPHLQVLVDAKPSRSVYRSAMDFLVIPFPAGEHKVEIRAVLSPLRRFCFAVSTLFLCAWILLFFRRHKERS